MRILLLEDTEDVADAIIAHFLRSGHAVDHVSTCESANDSLAVQEYDLLILDINLPDGTGVDVLRRVRAGKLTTPVLMLTARLDVEDRIEALNVGADDYLMKPFDLRELEARARALFRRGGDDLGGILEYGDLLLDPAGRVAKAAGKTLQLTRREFSLLEVLMANRGRVMPKDRIHEKMFSFADDDVGMNAIELYVGRLRKKLEASSVAVRTLRGLGYQLTMND